MSFELSAECLAARPTGPCTWDGSGPAHMKYRSRAARTSVRVPGVVQFSRVLSRSGPLSQACDEVRFSGSFKVYVSQPYFFAMVLGAAGARYSISEGV